MSEIAEILFERLVPVFDRFVLEITNHFELRVEAELARFAAALDSSLSVFVSEVEHVASDRRDHDPVPRVPRRTRRGLRNDESRGRERTDSGTGDGARPRAAQAADEGREEGQRAARLVDPLEDTLGSDLTRMMATASRPPKPRPAPVPFVPFSVENAGILKPPHLQSSRLGLIADRIKSAPHPFQRPTKPAPKEVDENPTADERWASYRITEATTIAEGQKRVGEFPVPRSSFEICAGPSGGGLDDVREVGSKSPARENGQKRPPRRCANCGELGRRADSCGVTHNIPSTGDVS